MSSTHVSVIIATRNRAGSLRHTLENLLTQDYPRDRLEIVVADNGSTDHTRGVVEMLELARPEDSLRYTLEPQQGKSFALNTGIASARGDLLAFTDDDVRVPSNWVSSLDAGFLMGPAAGVVGRTLLDVEGSIPGWLDLSLLWALGRVDLGETPHLIRRNVPGMNFAFRREIFERYGGFRTDMGPGAPASGFNEDSEFLQRIFCRGERMRYIPEATVYHNTPRSRLTKRYLRYRFWREGVSRAPLALQTRPGYDYRIRLGRRAVRFAMLACLARCRARPQEAFRHECEALWRLGLLWALVRLPPSPQGPSAIPMVARARR